MHPQTARTTQYQADLDPDTQTPSGEASASATTPARGFLGKSPAGTGDPSALLHGCRCGKRWGGNRTCHCGACHLTFSGVGPFDLHRKGGTCNDPAAMGLAVIGGRAYECWGNPATEEEADLIREAMPK